MYLTHLRVKNYALIDELELELVPGLNILSGETGAGKSIILESFALVLGEKVHPETIIRQPQNACQVTAEFRGKPEKELADLLKNHELKPETDDLILRRILELTGRGRTLVNDQPVNLSTLSAVGDYLVDIHGQHQHQSLLKNQFQRQFLDEYAENQKLLAELEEKYRLWQNKQKELAATEIAADERQRQIDLYQYQIKEIEAAGLREGEAEELRQQLPEIKNAARLKEIGGQICSLLQEEENSVQEQLQKVLRLLENLGQYTSRFNQQIGLVNESISRLKEIAAELSGFLEKIRVEPETLDEIYRRLDTIERLQKKYGPTVKDIFGYCQQTKEKLSGLINYADQRRQINEEIKKYEEEVKILAQKLSRRRKEAAEKLSRSIEKEIRELGMPKARFEIRLLPLTEIGATGQENVEFFFSANPGQDQQPLRFIASGGELSRVMLAIKTAANSEVPLLVFDEIDAGLSGPIGSVIGKKLKKLSRSKQIICITHLAQIAAYADRHFLVEKITTSKETRVKITTLDPAERVQEIARMISGQKIGPAAISQARELLKESENV